MDLHSQIPLSGNNSDDNMSSIHKSAIIGRPERYKGQRRETQNKPQESDTAEKIQESSQQLPPNLVRTTSSNIEENVDGTVLQHIIANCTDFYTIQETQEKELVENRMSPVNNATLNSGKSGRIILIKIKDVEERQVINNPIKIARMIAGSPFDSPNIKDIRTDKKQGIIIAELHEENQEMIKELLKIKMLGGTLQVDCEVPKNELYSYGVISPVSPNAAIEELQELMRPNEANVQIIKCERLNKKTDQGWVPSSVVKITFTGKNIARAVKIAHSYYPVRPYIPEPIMCYNCQRLGHKSLNCTAKTRCLLCGGNHNKKECSASNLKCVHCAGSHTANSKMCPIIKEARKIESLRAHEGFTYTQAKEKVIQERTRARPIGNDQYSRRQNYSASMNSNVDWGSSGCSNNIPTFSAVVQNVNTNARLKNFKTQGTQTESEITAGTENSIGRREPITVTNTDFFDKLKLCLLEVLRAQIMGENMSKQSMMIESALKKHFGAQSNGCEEPSTSAMELGATSKPENSSAVEKRQQGKRRIQSETEDDDVISQRNDSEGSAMFQTVEKKQIRVKKSRKSKLNKKQ